MNVYIAGPMRGYPHHNFPAFRTATALLRSMGLNAISPEDIGEKIGAQGGELRSEDFVRADLAVLLGCDGIAVLPNWQLSVGARCEVTVAITLGLLFFDAVTGGRIPAPAHVEICGGYERAVIVPDSDEAQRRADEELGRLAREVHQWQLDTFPLANARSKAIHLLEEAQELVASPGDPDEIADCFMLIVGMAMVQDFSLVDIVRAKLERNKLRKWGRPDKDGVVRHVEVPA